MARCVFLQLSGPPAYEVTFDALEWIVRIAQAPLFVLLRHVRVAWWTLARELALILDVVVLEKVVIYVVHHVEFSVTDRAYE